MAYEIRTRSFGEILDGAFQLYRRHFWIFLCTALSVSVPVLVVVDLATGSMQRAHVPRGELFIAMPLWFLAHVIQQAVLTIAIADAFMGRPVTYKGSFVKAAPFIQPLMAAAIMTGLGVMGGLMLFIVPGVILILAWLFTAQVIVVEHLPATASFRRSQKLTSGMRWRLWGLLFVLVVIELAVSYGTRTIIPDAFVAIPLVGPLIQQLPEMLLAPLYPGVLTLAYFDARVRKEGFDLEMLVSGVGSPDPALAAGMEKASSEVSNVR